MEQKLTQWFPSEVKPVYVGVYMTSAGDGMYQYWNGEYWGLFASAIDRAYSTAYGNSCSVVQSPRWRGLAEPPK